MELIRKAKCLCKFYNGLNSFLDKNNSLNNNEKVDEFKDTKQSLLKLLNDGVQFDFKYNECFLNDLLVYMKDNYDEAISLINDIIFIKQNNYFSYLHCAFFLEKDSSLSEIIIGKKFRERYSNFFSILNGECKYDFWNNIEQYLALMLVIVNKINDLSIDMRDEFFDKIIFNLDKVKELGIQKMIFRNDYLCEFNLEYQPKGSFKNILMGILRYKEENFFTDGEFSDMFDEDTKTVNVRVKNPSFVIRSSRVIGFGSGVGNFDTKKEEITIYDLNFDASLLPSIEDVGNTKCDLESYKMLEFALKSDLLKLKVDDFLEFSDKFDRKFAFLVNLAKELGIADDISDLFVIDEINENVKQLVKKVR